MFTRDQVGQVVGTIVIPEGQRQTEHYETAAWYRTHELKPGTYPVRLAVRKLWDVSCTNPYTTFLCAYDCTLVALVPTTVVDAYLGTLYGGMPIGPDRAGPREVGQPGQLSVRVAYGHTLDELSLRASVIPAFLRSKESEVC